MERLRSWLGREHDPASLTVFRVGFGLVAMVAAVRFVAMGWVEELLLAPPYHFAWVEWAVVPPPPVLYGLFALQVLGGALIVAGRRLGVALWLVGFGWVELLDKALYLNHYVLFTLLGLVLLAVPWRRAPGWSLGLLRLLVGSVYVWAGLAKLNPDWLLRAEPLATWLGARADVPVVGGLLAWEPTAFAMSWAGAAYDLSVPFLLLFPRTRALGVVLVVGFHGVVGVLFPIGIFPVLMVLAATLLLPADWPRRWSWLRERLPGWDGGGGGAVSPVAAAGWVVVVATLLLFPGRFVLHGADVSWTERGYRFAWRVMLNEKTGLVDYRVVDRATGQQWRVSPSEELTMVQHHQLRIQPDLIRQYARHLADQHAAEGRDVAVYADAWASLNGRRSQRLLRPDLDLTRPLDELDREGWILGREGAEGARGAW